MRLATITFCAFVVFPFGSAFAQQSLKSRHRVKIDPSQPAPGILYSDVLKTMQDQVAWKTGQVRMFERVRMTFLPVPSGGAQYDARNGARLAHTVTDAKGKVVNVAFWEARRLKFPFSNCSAVGNSSPRPLEPGKYDFTWHIEGQPFWKLPVTVTRTTPADAFEKPKYYFDGPWDKHAYIYVANGSRFATPSFNIFLRDKKSKPGNWVEKSITVDIKRDGKSIAGYPVVGKSRQTLRPWWERLTLSLRHSDGSGRALKAADVLKPGKYEVTVKLGGKLYAAYKYESKDGKLPMNGRQNRKTTKGIELLEGARDRFYIERVKK